GDKGRLSDSPGGEGERRAPQAAGRGEPRAAYRDRLRIRDKPPGGAAVSPVLTHQAQGSPQRVSAEEPRVQAFRAFPEAPQGHHARLVRVGDLPARPAERLVGATPEAYGSVFGPAVEEARPGDMAQALQGHTRRCRGRGGADQP